MPLLRNIDFSWAQRLAQKRRSSGFSWGVIYWYGAENGVLAKVFKVCTGLSVTPAELMSWVLLSLDMTKAEIRKQAIAQRKALSDGQVATYSGALLEHFAALDFSTVRTVHVFLPIAEKKEPDTFLFIDWLALHHPEIRVIVPRADFETALMHNYVYKGREGLEKNFYNIMEPAKGELHNGEVDMVLVPLLAFDVRGYRAGYGKGFYDRFLQGLDTLKIGLSFFGPLEQIEDIDVYDVRLDACITPEKIYRF